MCEKCGASSAALSDNYEEADCQQEAIAAWNRRAEPHWIPVTERLPVCEKGAEAGPILYRMKTTGTVEVGYFGRNGRQRDSYFRHIRDSQDGVDSDDVTHWMPLPASPENSRQHALQTGVCPMCEDCPDGCPVETPKDSRNVATNADRIRSMSDEELARFLGDEPPYLSTYDKYLEWLRQPAKEEHNETDRR